MRLYFTKMVVKTNTATVTRLKPYPGSPVRILNCDGIDAETGDLQVKIDLSLALTEDQAGFQVLKEIDGTTFKRGPVVEGLVAGVNIQLASVPGLGVEADGVFRGRTQVNAILPGSDQSEGSVSLVALDGALEDESSGVFFLNLPVGKASSMIGQIVLPSSGLIVNPKMELLFWVLARAAGTLPALPLVYRRMPLPAPNDCTKVDLPVSDTLLTSLAPGACGVMGANQYILARSAEFDVADGDVVLFKLSRAAADGFSGDVGILRMAFRIFA
jgi:hypothetical protein